ncbi:type II secretion system F family protein [Desulfovibrio mangrovi]|uniref:type II secretion system F family protein n=1 Tax=Desulfovibrio mangrovi TaxID=2976983 RepID=UPI002247ACBA|nr:type II secretion system F family protein [Desulfovibrio mangrovi]UZP65905.1 type II secretion system F family protein [Desulfovibrio mangrovi]
MGTIAIISGIAILGLFVLYIGMMNLLFARKRSQKELVRRRMERLRAAMDKTEDISIERHYSMSSVPWLHRFLSTQEWSRKWESVREQAQVDVNLGTLVLISGVGALAMWFVMQFVTDHFLMRPIPSLLFAYAPFGWLRRRQAKRMAHFHRQLPDALDLIARALKAGHAFTQGLRMVAEEMPDPIGPEFAKTLDEVNFGIAMDVALANLINRVDCPDLKFFVVSVNIQRETGGNLSEIVGNIARLVRERFKFNGRVRTLAAEGKLTAYVLFALPFAVGVVINLINADYMSLLYTTPEGKFMLTNALIQMGLGALFLKKLITIKV